MIPQREPVLTIAQRIARRRERIARWDKEADEVETSWTGGPEYRRFCERMAGAARESLAVLEAELQQYRGPSLSQPGEQLPATSGTDWLGAGAFLLMHVACLAVFLTGADVLALTLCGACYLLQMVGITAGYHRYFAHRSYRTSRAFQFVLACLGCSAAQKGPLWWAARHRHHHRTSDTPEDLHSPVTHSLWWSHIGWVLASVSSATDGQAVRDLSRYPELRWLDRNHWVSPLALAGLCFLLGSWSGLVWGFFVSSVLSHHATFTVNSLCHLWGRRRYATADASRNNVFVALITLGEGWHNNHHHYQSSTNQGFFWWEIDLSYYLLKVLELPGVVWAIRKPSPAVLAGVGGQAPPRLIPEVEL
jgi:stearoyl-CoA desaturase (delta-9 desaturase)